MTLFDQDLWSMVKVSAASMRQRFHGCTPEYIRDVCHGRCCRSSTAPGGTMVTIHPSEEAAIAARGGTVVDGLLESVDRRCPFQDADTELCSLHGTDDKPFGCIASPFTLNRNGTLIVRNRYRLLVCYDVEPRVPAYIAFRSSLDLLFEAHDVEALCRHLDAGGGDIHLPMAARVEAILRDNDAIKKRAANP